MLHLEPHATFTVPAARAGANRTLYFFGGSTLKIGSRKIPSSSLVDVRPDVPLTLQAGDSVVEILLLQGRPIGEPVVQHGPFVMNSRDEIVQTIREYQRTEFGGWPWQRRDPVHAADRGRFALHSDGRQEIPT
jgi:redox-sensitive bicupin YhaK (pirin superfamily)